MDIYQLLPNRIDFVFLLTESEENSGHWTLLIRDNNILNTLTATEQARRI